MPPKTPSQENLAKLEGSPVSITANPIRTVPMAVLTEYCLKSFVAKLRAVVPGAMADFARIMSWKCR
eukprot:m.75775 g.75775  ORF g.75775 m.75775 type:complete len:67 (-) comp20542_c0_seq2:902-1102(-)